MIGACAVLVVLLTASSARAAAPWCDALAQTIAAPPPIVAQHEGEIRAWKCSNNGPKNAVQQSPASPDQKPQTASPETPDKALGLIPAWPPPPNPTRLPKPEADRTGRPGYSLTVYRPPRR